MNDPTINLRKMLAEYRAYLEKQLRDCESGHFSVFSVENGKKIDQTPDHIATLKRLIAEHNRLLGEPHA